MRPGALLLTLAALTAQAGTQGLAQGGETADSGEPLSAIDWLSQSVAEPATRLTPDEDPVADSAAIPTITVTPLDSKLPDAVGLLSPAATGLPATLWSASSTEVLTTLIAAERADPLPAIQELVRDLMLARADPPADAGLDGALLLARVDRLLDMGALDPAQALLEAAGPDTPERFRRWFDVSLLNGSEDAACGLMTRKPAIAPTLPARIFCLAREGDWTAAALTLNSARALGEVSDEEDALLSRFLDPDLYEGEAPLAAPSRTSPLVYRLREAIGDPLPEAGLPRAFAQADLRPTKPWRLQLEAAERLARNGAIQPTQLFDIYTARVPAASGGVWDRAAAVQAFDAAIRKPDAKAVAAALPAVWEAMRDARVEVAFAREYAEQLAAIELSGSAADLAFEIGLLGPDYEAAALAHDATTSRDRLLVALARGAVDGEESQDPRVQAVIDGFGSPTLPEPIATQIADGKLGEALLRSIAVFDQGVDGDTGALRDALAILRSVGLEDVARRAALQLLLLDRAS